MDLLNNKPINQGNYNQALHEKNKKSYLQSAIFHDNLQKMANIDEVHPQSKTIDFQKALLS